MSQPEEFQITIEPDGRIILDGRGLHETSYRRILELLEATVGPVQELQRAPGEPPATALHRPAVKSEAELDTDELRLERGD